jgi:hypothetical protein
VDKAQRKALINKIKVVTKKWRDELNAKPIKISARAKELAAVIDGKFGCNEVDVRNLVSAITGETLPTPGEKLIRPEVFAAIVPLNEHNMHSYPIGVASIITDTGSNICNAIQPNGKMGNGLSVKPGNSRPATDEEIDALADLTLGGVILTKQIVFL